MHNPKNDDTERRETGRPKPRPPKVMDREPSTGQKPKTRQRGEGYRVLLFNDDQHTMDEVAIQIMVAIDCDTDMAMQIMMRAHNNGCATVTITSRTEARRVAKVLREIALRVAVEQV